MYQMLDREVPIFTRLKEAWSAIRSTQWWTVISSTRDVVVLGKLVDGYLALGIRDDYKLASKRRWSVDAHSLLKITSYVV